MYLIIWPAGRAPPGPPKCPQNRPKIYQKYISDCSLPLTSLFYQFFKNFSFNHETSNPQNHQKTQCFLMFLHIRHFKVYDTLACDSCQKNAPFWPPKSSKIVPQTYKNRCWFFNRLLVRFLFDFEAHLGSILAPKPLQDAPSTVPQWRPERS